MWRRQPRARSVRPPTVGRSVVRKVDSSGNVSFAGTSYRAGNAYRRQQVEVSVVGDTVQISANGRLGLPLTPLGTTPYRAHGTFTNPRGPTSPHQRRLLTRGEVSCRYRSHCCPGTGT